jgi:NAD(P)-dependent dehydrogenase (short-subunit alcohol dehydrogenase family)
MDMRIKLAGKVLTILGDDNPLCARASAALLACGARRDDGSPAPDILLMSLPLVARDDLDVAAALVQARQIGAAMAERGGGRILVLLSALAGLPMRRHPAHSAAMAGAAAGMRTLAMTLGPEVHVNALGLGAIGDPPLSGDAAMPGHSPLARAGTPDEIVGPVLFLCDPMNSYTTGQLLLVDGGWSTGYGRNF